METLLELERNPRPGERASMWTHPAMRRSAAGLLIKRAAVPSSPSTPVLHGQGSFRRSIPRPHWSGAKGHLPPLRRAYGGYAGTGWSGRAAPVPGAEWHPDRHLLPQLCGFLKGPAFNRFTLDGGVEIFPSELFDGEEKMDCYVSPRGVQGPHRESLLCWANLLFPCFMDAPVRM